MSDQEGTDTDPDRTQFRRPAALLAGAPSAEEVVHLLRVQSTDLAAPMEVRRLEPGALIIGRAEGCDLLLAGPDVSRRHCRIDLIGADVLAGGEVLATDLGSTNGTFVDGTRISQQVALKPGARLAIGPYRLVYERRGRRELETVDALDQDLQRARQYVLDLLPAQLDAADLRIDWVFRPCARLGGDCFGYRRRADGAYAGYLMDGATQGLAAAMHAVSVASVLRAAGGDGDDPAAVMGRLNASYPVAAHATHSCTMWCWVFWPHERRLDFCAAGHHPALLLAEDRERLAALHAPNPAIGSAGGTAYTARSVTIPPRSKLVIFSNVVLALRRPDGAAFTLEDMAALIRGPERPGIPEPQRLFDALIAATGTSELEDDLALVVLHFP
ncbi:MAG: SpoIIE family protein phosphatase [Rhodospirillales bacterium]|nr:SpoIIE family protein phosphatase [Rhodospirillales bacterium]MDE2200656.1 SpoIIE family protein phosphatase [Rhodospirillales bacterium]